MIITEKEAKILGSKFQINYKIVPFNQWLLGLNIELEHGTQNPKTNVTNDNKIKTAKIAIAHLEEIPDYYKRLKSLENRGNKYWKNKNKNIYIKK